MWEHYWSDKKTYIPNYNGDLKGYAKRFDDYLPKNKDAKILDVGCGKANFCYYLKKKGYNNFIGIDISEESVRVGQVMFPEHIIKADAFAYLESRINEFDFIFMGNFLEHIEKKSIIKILDLCHRALKRGGKLIIIVPNQSNPTGVISRYSDFTHEVGFTARSLLQVLNFVGFRKTLIFPYSIDASELRWLRKMLFKLLKRIFGISSEYEFFYSKRLFSISIN